MMSSDPQNIVTKLGMVMQQNESECHGEQKLFAVFKVKVTVRALMIKYDSDYNVADQRVVVV